MKTQIILFAVVLVIAGISIYSNYFRKKKMARSTGLGAKKHTHDQDEDEDDAMPAFESRRVMTRERWKNDFESAGLVDSWPSFEPLLRNEIAFANPTPDNQVTIGQTKIGGEPDLPKTQKWFTDNNGKSLSFVAQVNLSQVGRLDADRLLPEKGILYFFYSATQESWGFDPKDADQFKVYYFAGDVGELERKSFPEDLPQEARFTSCRVALEQSVSLPDWESNEVAQILSEDELDNYTEMMPVGAEAKLLGYSNNVQGPMEEQCTLVTQGIYTGDSKGYTAAQAKKLRKEAPPWRLLFQLGSIDEAGMMWGDSGKLYFWISEPDLAARRFEKSWCILQCY